MKIQIKNRWTGNVIFETDAEKIGAAVAAAIAAQINLSGANLSGANLHGANLHGANLHGADLRDANLSDANLSDAYLSGADLSDANLSDAYLSGADLSGAYLHDANLHGADLSGANLRGADLSGADLSKQQLADLIPTRTILPEGDLIGWKKLSDGTICKLKIPADAKRVGGLIGRKCRAEYAIVLEGKGASKHESGFVYTPGAMVRPDKYDPNPLEECSHGIHFFITKEEAESY